MAQFTCFNNLPLELRLQIWGYLLPEPRVIDINLSIGKDQVTHCAPPVLLSVCSESRSVVLRRYRTAFTTRKYPAGVYVDPRRDTILLLPPCPASCYKRMNCFECVHFDYRSHLSRYGPGVESVRNVAVYGFGLEGLASVWRFFPEMRLLSVVLDEPGTDFEQRREELKNRVKGLLEMTGENSPELLQGEAVEVKVVRAEEVRYVEER